MCLPDRNLAECSFVGAVVAVEALEWCTRLVEDQAFSSAANIGHDPDTIHVSVVAADATAKRRFQLDAGNIFELDRGAQF